MKFPKLWCCAALLAFSPLTFAQATKISDNVVRIGVITDATKNLPVEWQQSFLKARALSRQQRPADLVGTALYLLSDLASFVSGQTIVVDGGHIMY